MLAPIDPYNSIGGYMSTVANGTMYLAGFGGDIWSINMLTGAINWYTNTTALQGPSGTNSPYGVWPLWPFSSEALQTESYSSKKDTNTVRHYSLAHNNWLSTAQLEACMEHKRFRR